MTAVNLQSDVLPGGDSLPDSRAAGKALVLGMGATLDVSQFQSVLKSPKPFLIGMLSQFGIMPLIGF